MEFTLTQNYTKDIICQYGRKFERFDKVYY